MLKALTSDCSFHKVLVPFMNRNGYRDGNDWWVEYKDEG